MRLAAFTRPLKIILTTCGLGLLTAACLNSTTDETTEFPEQVSEIKKGPGLFTGTRGEAVFDATTGKWSIGDGDTNAINNEKTYKIRRRRALARRKTEGATAE